MLVKGLNVEPPVGYRGKAANGDLGQRPHAEADAFRHTAGLSQLKQFTEQII